MIQHYQTEFILLNSGGKLYSDEKGDSLEVMIIFCGRDLLPSHHFNTVLIAKKLIIVQKIGSD